MPKNPQVIARVSINTLLTVKEGKRETGQSHIKKDLILHVTQNEFDLRLKKALDILNGVKVPAPKKKSATKVKKVITRKKK